MLRFIDKTINALDDKIKYICYDNACHLSDINENLKDKIFVIDRYHLKNHKQSKCRTTHNCETYPELTELNTEICEQKFLPISKLKHQVKHMNKNRFQFFFLEYFNLANMKESLKLKNL